MSALLLLAFLTVATSPAAAAVFALASELEAAGSEDGGAHVEGRLLVDPERGEGGTLRAGVLLTLDPGWTVAWRHPGAVGRATRVRWRGAEAGPVTWPAPEVFREPKAPLARFGYTEDVLLTSELVPHEGATQIEAEVEALVCRTACIPVRLSLRRAVDHVEEPEVAASVRRLFARHVEELPRPAERFGLEPQLEDLGSGRLALRLEPCTGRSPCRSLAAPRFVPSVAGFRVLDTSDAGGAIVILIEREHRAPQRLAGVLSLTTGEGRTAHVEIDLAPSAWAPRLGGLRAGLLLFLASVLGLLAGASMPPAESPEESRPTAYGAGVLTIVLLWTGLVVAAGASVQAAGGAVGSDSTGFAVAAALLCTAAALSGFGLWAFPSFDGPVEHGETKPHAPFVRGLRAPLRSWCSGLPLFASALAVSLFFEPRSAAASAFFLGLGAAVPPSFPVTLRLLGEPLTALGPLREELRRTLGFVLLGATAWLVVVVARGAGPDAAGALIAALLALTLTLSAVSRWGDRRLRAGALGLGALLVAVSVSRALAPAATPVSAEPGVWGAETVERLRAMHRPVLVVFTADWCIPCRWNEQAVVASAPVRSALVREGYTVLRADWTDQGETIRRELARFDRAGVPLTLAYGPDADEPERLPDVLTVEDVLAALEGADAVAGVEPGS
jgi:thiol:disulfide interchange protein DsbD